MTSNNVTIKISGALTFEEEISLSQAAQIIAFIDKTSGNPPANDYSSQKQAIIPLSDTRSLDSNISPREYLEKHTAESIPQKIVALGKYYLETNIDEEGFTPQDIQRLFERAKERMPRNFSRDLKVAVQNGWLDNLVNDPRKYRVTNTGEDQLNSGFKAEIKKKLPASKRSHRAISSHHSQEKDDNLSTLQLSPTALGLPGYWDKDVNLTKEEKALWILVAAKEKGFTELTPSQINKIATSQLTDSNFSNLAVFLKGLIRKNFVAKSGSSYAAIQPGIEHIKNKAAVKV